MAIMTIKIFESCFHSIFTRCGFLMFAQNLAYVSNLILGIKNVMNIRDEQKILLISMVNNHS